jgi:hypothetical protein
MIIPGDRSGVKARVFLIWAVVAGAATFTPSAGQALAKDRHVLRRAPIVKPDRTLVHGGLQSGTLVLKFSDDVGYYASGGRLFRSDGQPVTAIQALVDGGRIESVRPEFSLDKSMLMRWRSEGETAASTRLADLTAYFRLTLPAGASVADAARLADLLNRSADVEIAFLEAVPEVAGDITPATPDFEPQQDYLKPAPGGVDAYAAWGYPGGKGEGVTICDIEFGWNTNHEDLTKLVGGVIGGGASIDNHGTAVMGEMVADSSVSGLSGIGYGVTGIAHGASARMVSVNGRSTADAILLATANLSVGDIIIIELQQAGPNGSTAYVPMEWTPSVFDAIQTSTANGLIVCEAAGNGAQNLNDAVYGGWFDTTLQHSGAIMCGAGAPPSGVYGPDRSRLSFSNYGMRVDLQGYGNGVVTTGYGGLFNPGDPLQLYTATFSGTSSATPIVTASVACVQGRFKAISGGYTMTAKEIRDLLHATGSLQTGITSQNIGRRPDLGAALPLLSALSAYASPRTINVSLLDNPYLTDTLWLVNPNAATASFAISIIDSLPIMPSLSALAEAKQNFVRNSVPTTSAAAATAWIAVTPMNGSISPGDSLPVEVAFNGNLLSSSYFGAYYKARLDVAVDGQFGPGTLPVPILVLAQDSLHGDTIQITTAAISHRATSETNMQGWEYNLAPTGSWLYDGSFLVGRRATGDTTVYRDIFGNARNWRGRDTWLADSSRLPGYVVWHDSSMTEDSIIGLAYEAWEPTSGPHADFVYWRVNLYGRQTSYPNILFGIAGDWDLPASSGANNFGGFDTTRQMIFQTGNTGYENSAAGYALLRAGAYSAVVGSNLADVYPAGGFTDGRLYVQMRTAGFRVDANDVDLHTILTTFFGTLPAAPGLDFEVVVLSSRSGKPGLDSVYARAKQLSDTLRYLSCPVELTGDINIDGILNSADIIGLVNYIFKGGTPPLPIPLAGDVDCSAAVASSDIIYMVNHIFKGGLGPCDACTIY